MTGTTSQRGKPRGDPPQTLFLKVFFTKQGHGGCLMLRRLRQRHTQVDLSALWCWERRSSQYQSWVDVLVHGAGAPPLDRGPATSMLVHAAGGDSVSRVAGRMHPAPKTARPSQQTGAKGARASGGRGRWWCRDRKGSRALLYSGSTTSTWSACHRVPLRCHECVHLDRCHTALQARVHLIRQLQWLRWRGQPRRISTPCYSSTGLTVAAVGCATYIRVECHGIWRVLAGAIAVHSPVPVRGGVWSGGVWSQVRHRSPRATRCWDVTDVINEGAHSASWFVSCSGTVKLERGDRNQQKVAVRRIEKMYV